MFSAVDFLKKVILSLDAELSADEEIANSRPEQEDIEVVLNRILCSFAMT